MTNEMQKLITSEIRAAEKADDAPRLSRAMTNAMIALIDCQRKTSERVKDLCAARENARQRIKGAALLWDALKLVATAGGGALVLRLVQAG